MTGVHNILIIGTGVAAHSLASELIRLDFPGRITLVGEELGSPYDRPPLSKEFLANGDEESVLLTPLPQEQVCVFAGDPVVSLNTADKLARTSSGRELHWHKLVIATGSVPRLIAGWVPDGKRIHVLRTLDDARRIRKELTHGQTVALVGAGPIGLELAAQIRAIGKNVILLDAADRVMGRSVPEVVSRYVEQSCREAGIDLRLSAAIGKITANGSIELPDGQLQADLVILGLGVLPDDGLAAKAGIAVKNGILVDERLQTNIPGVHAIGDVANVFRPSLGRHERSETWWSAKDQAVALARILVDGDAAPPFAALPWFWSDQSGLFIQGAGAVIGETETLRGEVEDGSFSVLQWSGAKLVGVTSVNAQRDFQVLRKLIEAGGNVDPAAVSDPAVKLRKLLPA